jgi:hypothetical protein
MQHREMITTWKPAQISQGHWSSGSLAGSYKPDDLEPRMRTAHGHFGAGVSRKLDGGAGAQCGAASPLP